MAEQHGGYRKPAHPAPTSPPGAMSQRTDGGPADTQPMRQVSGGGYGDSKDMTEIQQGAPQAGSPTQQGPAPDLRGSVVPLSAPTNNPDQPLTAGAATGPGVGPEGAGIDTNVRTQDLAALKDIMPALEYIANGPTGSPSARAFIRSIKAGA